MGNAPVELRGFRIWKGYLDGPAQAGLVAALRPVLKAAPLFRPVTPRGQAMSVRDRGPFWIMLPLSERPELDDPLYHRFMVWQLSGIELE